MYWNPKTANQEQEILFGHLTKKENISKNNPTSRFPRIHFSSGLLGQNRVISKALPRKEIEKLVSRISDSVVGGKLRTKKEEGLEKDY